LEIDRKGAGGRAAGRACGDHDLPSAAAGARIEIGQEGLSELLSMFRIAAVDEDVFRAALLSPAPDFEDAVSAAAAQSAGFGPIVARSAKSFPGAAPRVVAPEIAAALLAG
jgi:hypothetical protein